VNNKFVSLSLDHWSVQV